MSLKRLRERGYTRKREIFINIVLLMIALSIESVVFTDIYVPHLFVGAYIFCKTIAKTVTAFGRELP